jgi:uncharacterized LabA/DUF88 family protein
MRKYIKVTEKGRSPVVILASNESFYKARGAKIEIPTQEEIEKSFPQEKEYSVISEKEIKKLSKKD